MANIMSMVSLKNKTSYNGFDLSTKRNFTMKAGQLTPVWWQYVLPGDKFNINLSQFTRTVPVNTSAFARIRQYFDFYFVPLEFLWNKVDNVMTQMNNNIQHAPSFVNPFESTDGTFPHTDLLTLAKFVNRVAKFDETGYGFEASKDFFGFSRAKNMARLLEYLGYGDFMRFADVDSPVPTVSDFLDNAKVGLFPLAAYQKIYSDRYRYTQWERANSSCFNFDYIKGSGDTDISSLIDTLFTVQSSPNIGYNMFDLRYCNYQKDLFHGVLPQAQYGSTSAVPLNVSGSVSGNVTSIPLTSFSYVGAPSSAVQDGNNIQTASRTDSSVRLSIATTGNPTLDVLSTNAPINASLSNAQASLSILMLRQYEALQRWKEVAQAADEDYKSQIEAHWNVSVSDYLSHMTNYLGGIATSLDINEVVNTNLANGIESNGAFIRGKGIGSGKGSINFEAKDRYGIIMCVCHILPLVDYVTSGVSGQNLLVDATSFPIPEMDSIGMETLPRIQLMNTPADGTTVDMEHLGFVPRYINWKTDFDKSFGAFRGSLDSWVLPYSDSDFYTSNAWDDIENPNVPKSDSVGFSFFKVNPSIMDKIFLVASDDDYDTDQFWITSMFDVKVTRKLDYNGLPY